MSNNQCSYNLYEFFLKHKEECQRVVRPYVVDGFTENGDDNFLVWARNPDNNKDEKCFIVVVVNNKILSIKERRLPMISGIELEKMEAAIYKYAYALGHRQFTEEQEKVLKDAYNKGLENGSKDYEEAEKIVNGRDLDDFANQ